jgi:hypothetical protein
MWPPYSQSQTKIQVFSLPDARSPFWGYHTSKDCSLWVKEEVYKGTAHPSVRDYIESQSQFPNLSQANTFIANSLQFMFFFCPVSLPSVPQCQCTIVTPQQDTYVCVCVCIHISKVAFNICLTSQHISLFILALILLIRPNDILGRLAGTKVHKL